MARLNKILAPFASLRLTVTLLALSILLVFAGTSAQKEAGIWDVQHTFFHSFFAWIPLKYLLPLSNWWWSSMPGRFPMLGGYSLIILLLSNLLAAHSVRFKLSWKRSGILVIHAGLILLIGGEIVTSLFQVESRMTIEEGQTVSWSQDIRSPELAVVDVSPADHDNVVAIPAARFARSGAIVSDAKLPFQVRVDDYYPNAAVLGPFQLQQMGKKPDARATAGSNMGVTVVDLPRVSGTDSGRVDMPSAYVTLTRSGENLGTFLLTSLLDRPQRIEIDGKPWELSLRFKRIYRPYAIHLKKFSFDRYTGTNVPKNYSSDIRLIDPRQNVDRDLRIWMNHPLRYGGETFFQADFNHETEHGTVLQVVRNPGWLIPYISCSMVALGMLVHFGMHLLTFLKRRTAEPTPVAVRPHPELGSYTLKPRPSAVWPALLTLGCAVYLLSAGQPPKSSDAFDLRTFSGLPISYEGRVMPLDSLARNSLRIISGRDTLFVEDPSKLTWFHKMFSIPAGKSYPASKWMLDVMARPEQADEYRIFRIDHPDVLSMLGLPTDRTRFAAAEIAPHIQKLDAEYRQIRHSDPKKLDLYQRKVVELGDHVVLYQSLGQIAGLYFAPPTRSGDEWQTVAQSIRQTDSGGTPVNPGVTAIATLLEARHTDKPDDFNTNAVDYLSWTRGRMPDLMQRVWFETLFNRVEPFYQCMIFYVLVFLLICISWLTFPATLQRAALWLLCFTLAFHTLGLVARVYIQGRPPVTNLYSSAIFIAWGVVVMCLILELIFKNSIGTMVAAVVGFLSLLIAHNLAGSGDTMQMLQAVLDTNIWLATHVVVVTLGYASTFLAGFLAIVYVARGVLTRSLPNDEAKSLSKMIYGIICFAMLFSFVGTILGGIWADQSWGRFWGWDPKENGAVLIVLWNALILHARWGGLVRERGVAVLAILGNIVTAWSWFGTNMLGIGLHSYGFMDSAAMWLGAFVLVQLAFVALGSIPLRSWPSFAQEPARPRADVRSSRKLSKKVPNLA